MRVVAGAARAAGTAGGQRVEDDRVTFAQIRYARANLLDPAGVLVPQGKGHLVGDAVEDTLHQVEVRSTYTGAGDAQQITGAFHIQAEIGIENGRHQDRAAQMRLERLFEGL